MASFQRQMLFEHLGEFCPFRINTSDHRISPDIDHTVYIQLGAHRLAETAHTTILQAALFVLSDVVTMVHS